MSSADDVSKVNNQGGIICQGRKQEKNRCNVKLFPPSRECLSWSWSQKHTKICDTSHLANIAHFIIRYLCKIHLSGCVTHTRGSQMCGGGGVTQKTSQTLFQTQKRWWDNELWSKLCEGISPSVQLCITAWARKNANARMNYDIFSSIWIRGPRKRGERQAQAQCALFNIKSPFGSWFSVMRCIWLSASGRCLFPFYANENTGSQRCISFRHYSRFHCCT